MTSTRHNMLSERQQQILQATLELVASEGLINTSMSKISKRAQCSPGIVYHYFESKDEIMDTLFIRIVSEMMDYIMDDKLLAQPILERYQGLWLRKYHFHYNNPDKTIFLEQYKNSSYYTAVQAAEMQQHMSGLLQMGRNDIEQGLAANLPLDVIYNMTFTVAINLATAHIQTNTQLDPTLLNKIAERACRSVLI